MDVDIKGAINKKLKDELKRVLTSEEYDKLEEIFEEAIREQRAGNLDTVASRNIMIRIAGLLGPDNRDLVLRLDALPWPHTVFDIMADFHSRLRSLNSTLGISFMREAKRALTRDEMRQFSSLAMEAKAEYSAGRFDADCSRALVERLAQLLGDRQDLLHRMLNVFSWPHHQAHLDVQHLQSDGFTTAAGNGFRRSALSILNEAVKKLSDRSIDPERKAVYSYCMFKGLCFHPGLMRRFKLLALPTRMPPLDVFYRDQNSGNERSD